MIYHIASMLAGFLMDLLLGDPYWLPHPIRLIGNWISFLEKKMCIRDSILSGCRVQTRIFIHAAGDDAEEKNRCSHVAACCLLYTSRCV